MPLIILTGIPSSGKTTRAKELQNFLEQHNKNKEKISNGKVMVSVVNRKSAR